MKELLFKSYELGVSIRFTPITEERYERWVSLQGKNRYILTLLGRKLTAVQIAEVTRVVADQGLNIDMIQRLTGRIPLREDVRSSKSCVELSVRGTPRNKGEMQRMFMELSMRLQLDISFQEDDMPMPFSVSE